MFLCNTVLYSTRFTSITSHTHSWVLFLLWLHLFILSGVIYPLFSIAYWASTNLGSPSLHVLSNPDQTFVINLLNYLFCENLKISAASCQTHIFPACLLAKLLLLFYSVKQPVNHKIQNHKQPYKLLHVIPNIPLYQNIGQNFMKTYFWIQIENEKKV